MRAHTLKRGSLRIETETAGLEESLPPLDPAVTREGRFVLLDGAPLAEADGPLHGLALDIGTTTVALRLYDLETGRLLATQSFENPQRFGGSDIMARIHYDGAHKGRLLQRTLLGYLSRAILACPGSAHDLRARGGRQPHHARPALRPRRAADRRPALSLHHRGRAQGRPRHHHEPRRHREEASPPGASRGTGLRPALVGSHVGADAAACLLATGMAEGEGLSALLDIGTNTEAFLGNRQRILAASCPAVPPSRVEV